MKSFKITKQIEIVCDSARTRNGFKHTATLLIDGREQENVKINYQNRTWERYEYQSVLEKLVAKSTILSDRQKRTATKFIKNYKEDSGMGAIGMIMAMGDIFAKTPKAKNDWKERMLKAGLEGRGLIMPDDWNELDEATKQARLDGAAQVLMEKN